MRTSRSPGLGLAADRTDGAKAAKTYVNDDVVVCFLDDLELLPSEAYLISRGHGTNQGHALGSPYTLVDGQGLPLTAIHADFWCG